MKNKLFLCWLILFFSLSAAAQSDTLSSSPAWFWSAHAGALVARNPQGTSFTAAVIQGVRYKRLFLGVGLGYDEYFQWRTLPLFTNFGYDFARRDDHSFFIQMNTGFSRAWHSPQDDAAFTFEGDGGYFFHPQFGFRLHRGKGSFYVIVGYKLQELNYDQIPRGWNGWGPQRVSIEHDIRRISIQLGFGLH